MENVLMTGKRNQRYQSPDLNSLSNEKRTESRSKTRSSDSRKFNIELHTTSAEDEAGSEEREYSESNINFITSEEDDFDSESDEEYDSDYDKTMRSTESRRHKSMIVKETYDTIHKRHDDYIDTAVIGQRVSATFEYQNKGSQTVEEKVQLGYIIARAPKFTNIAFAKDKALSILWDDEKRCSFMPSGCLAYDTIANSTDIPLQSVIQKAEKAIQRYKYSNAKCESHYVHKAPGAYKPYILKFKNVSYDFKLIQCTDCGRICKQYKAQDEHHPCPACPRPDWTHNSKYHIMKKIYFIQQGDMYKIGTTVNTQRRNNNISENMKGKPLTITTAIPTTCSESVEIVIHRYTQRVIQKKPEKAFQLSRSAEWYTLNDAQVDTILSVPNPIATMVNRDLCDFLPDSIDKTTFIRNTNVIVAIPDRKLNSKIPEELKIVASLVREKDNILAKPKLKNPVPNIKISIVSPKETPKTSIAPPENRKIRLDINKK